LGSASEKLGRAKQKNEVAMRTQTISFPFIDKAYVDAMELLKDTRDYAQNCDSFKRDYPDPDQRMVIVSETSRLVSHVVNVMSWLLLKKAVENGEVSDDIATEKCRRHLSEEVFSDRLFEIEFELPQNLSNLMSRSDVLHARVDRIKCQMSAAH